jgi:hypothetical protein
MKKALVSPKENVFAQGFSGYRVAEVAQQEFEVAPPMFWVDCPDDCLPDLWFYNTTSEKCELTPPSVPPEPETPVEILP